MRTGVSFVVRSGTAKHVSEGPTSKPSGHHESEALSVVAGFAGEHAPPTAPVTAVASATAPRHPQRTIALVVLIPSDPLPAERAPGASTLHELCALGLVK